MDMGTNNLAIKRKFIQKTLNNSSLVQMLLTLNEQFEAITISWRGEPFFTHQIVITDDNNNQFTVRYGWNEKSEKWVFELL